MIVYMKSRKTFQTNYKAYAQGWDVPVMASTHERGTIIIPKRDKKDFTGDFVYFDKFLFMVDESSPKDGTIELTVSDMANLFSRQIVYPPDEEIAPYEVSYGDFIEHEIEQEFIGCTDPAYRIDYLIVHNADEESTYERPNLTDTRLFSLTDVIAAARKKGVLFNFYIEDNKLVLDISSPITVPHNIVFDDGHTTLDNETFSRVKTAKVTVLKQVENTDTYTETTWYLKTDGDIVDTEPALEDRPEGDWVYLTIKSDEDPHDKAAEEFKNNISSHKIEFYSDRSYYLWDTVNFVIDGELLQSSIISAYLSSSNNRYLYKCGDLATTLTEKVQKIS